METFNFITVRLGKDSIPEIQKICLSAAGVLENPFSINVKCTQVPDNYGVDDYAFLWLGSDNNKGMPTQWKQGFKAVGRVANLTKGKSYNDTSETTIKIVYVFHEAINRMDILRNAPIAYYWCSSMPLIGLDDHANQTIRNMSGSSFADLRAFFSAIEAVTNHFKKDILQIEPRFEQFFDFILPNPQSYPTAKNLDEISFIKHRSGAKTLQQIYYGAPGTGKSHTINEITEKQPKKNVFRTTFHPDSDYATFVGCYKPTKEATSIFSLHKLHELYPEFKTKVENRPLHRFIIKNYNSFRLLTEKEAESVFDKIETSSTVTAEVPKIMAAIEEIPTTASISYSFVPQTFTKAYLRAWQTEDPVFLVIEEINRGNCAQIFGDLFQLLDRKNGFSEYPIKADNDLAAYIGEQLSKESREGIPETVKSGEELILPPNLFIWATMNTSDQSLFPIDSAFKRRWEWKYIKIAWPYKKKEDGTFKMNENGEKIHFNYQIEGGHDWWEFLQQINAIIDKMTNSADKQLGYFFAKAKDDVISYDTFVSKVCFYLWNDIFKTYALDEQQGDLFSYTDNEGKKKQLTFPAFYDGDGNVIKEVAEAFIGNVMRWNTDTKNDKA